MNLLKPELKILVYIFEKLKFNHPESASHRWFSGKISRCHSVSASPGFEYVSILPRQCCRI
jgi:hypothetical protein